MYPVKILDDNNIRLSEHIYTQAQKRGIRFDIIFLLLKYGESKHDNHGCVIRFFKKDNIENRLGTAFNQYKKVLQDHIDVYLVESLDNSVVVTVGHKTKRRKDKPSHRFSPEFHMKQHFYSCNH